MNRNLLKQIWNEHRSNAFLWMELFVVFVILWYIVDVVYVTLSIYNLPMGFDIENTYVLRFERMTSKAAAYQPGRTMKEDVADLHEIVNRLAHRPDVEAVSLSQNCIPYNDGANSFSFYLDTVPVRSLKRWITPEYFNVFRYRNIDGSGSESLAEALTPSGMVLSVNIADVYQDAPWHGKELLGRRVPVWRNEPEAEHLSIAALTEPVRYDHFTAPDDYGSRYAAVYLTDEALESLGETVYIEVCLRVREGQNDGFIDRLIVDADRQYQVGNLYLLDITPLSDVRTAYETDSVNELNTAILYHIFLIAEYLSRHYRNFLVPDTASACRNSVAYGFRIYPLGNLRSSDGGRSLVIADICYSCIGCGVEFGICRTGGSYTYAFYGRSFCDYGSGHFYSDCWNDCHWNRIPCPSCHEYRTG